MTVLIDSPGWAGVRPVLSVLTPFLRDDPSALLALLDREAGVLNGKVEIVLLDDGTNDPVLTRRLEVQLTGLDLPARMIVLDANEGRSLGRNRLASAARGKSLLFLDSDMRPDTVHFLQDWLALIRAEDPAVAFGGFSLEQAPRDAAVAVHRAMAARSDCLPAEARAREPGKYVFTSNLLVRRDVFDSEAFDDGFTGWGWEDVEWGLRVSKRHAIRHVDIPATHMGLDTVETLTRKYEQAAPNFVRLARLHPAMVEGYPSYRLARRLKRAPGLGLLRALTRRLAGAAWAPTAARAFSLRLYRTALYARAL